MGPAARRPWHRGARCRAALAVERREGWLNLQLAQTAPCASTASPTFRKAAMLAPAGGGEKGRLKGGSKGGAVVRSALWCTMKQAWQQHGSERAREAEQLRAHSPASRVTLYSEAAALETLQH